MNDLEDILYDPQRYFVRDPDTGDFIEYDMNASLQLSKQAIIDLFLGLVGEDDAFGSISDWGEGITANRNNLRKELRTKIRALSNKEAK